MSSTTQGGDLTTRVDGVELVSTGTWDASTGKTRITTADLDAMVQAYGDPHADAIPLKIGHDDDRFQDAEGNPPTTRDGEPAYGWIENLRLSTDKHMLLGDLVGVPRMLADIMGTALRRRSVELVRHDKVGGKVYAAVLKALSLLGVQAPAVKGLADLRSLFAGADPDLVPVRMSVMVTDEVPDTPTVPQSADVTPNGDTQRPNEHLGAGMNLNPMQKRAMGIPDGATPEEIAAILKKLGLTVLADGEETPPVSVSTDPPPAATTDPTPPPVVAAVPAATTAPATAPAPAPAPAPLPVAAAAAPPPVVAEPPTAQAVLAAAGQLGFQVVDAAAFSQLQRDAAAGAAARAQQDKDRRDRLVQGAVQGGKIAASAYTQMRAMADRDEDGVISLFAAMPAALPTTAIGHSEQFTGNADEDPADTKVATAKAKRVYDYFGIPFTTEPAKG